VRVLKYLSVFLISLVFLLVPVSVKASTQSPDITSQQYKDFYNCINSDGVSISDSSKFAGKTIYFEFKSVNLKSFLYSANFTGSFVFGFNGYGNNSGQTLGGINNKYSSILNGKYNVDCVGIIFPANATGSFDLMMEQLVLLVFYL
jgi:hypothetical protein